VAKLLAGYRDRPGADRGAIARALVALSQLVIDHPAILGIDVNPLLADRNGAIALDARIEIDPARLDADPEERLAIRPYPSRSEAQAMLAGREATIRPIRPEDVALYPAFLERVTSEDMRLRFLVPTRTLSERMLVRLTQLDYDRDIAFVAIDDATGELMGIVRYAADPDKRRAEYGVLVRSDLKHHGLGTDLMNHLIGHARREGIGELFGLVLHENVDMLALCDALGFIPEGVSDDPSMLRVVLPVAASGEA
jgi:acetyltransferase